MNSKKTFSKKSNFSFKKIWQIILLILFSVSVIISISFSITAISKKSKFDYNFAGGYDAIVDVYGKEKSEKGLPNGDANKALEVLEKKISPFEDNSVKLSKAGNNRINVTTSKQLYRNNKNYFKNTIETNAGFFIFDENYRDILLNEKEMKKAGGKEVLEYNNEKRLIKKLRISDFLSDTKAKSLRASDVQNKNSSFITFKSSSYFNKIITPDSEKDKDSKGLEALTMISSVPEILQIIRSYNFHNSEDTKDSEEHFLKVYLEQIIKPLQVYINKDGNGENRDEGAKNTTRRNVLLDFFAMNYMKQNNQNEWEQVSASLIGNKIQKWWSNNALGQIENIDDLKAVLFGIKPNSNNKNKDANYKFDFINPISKYIYDPNTNGDDFNIKEKEEGKYYNQVQSTKIQEIDVNTLGFIDSVTNDLTESIFKNILFKWNKQDSENRKSGMINENLDENLFYDDVIVYNNKISNETGISTKNSFLGISKENGFNENTLFVPVYNNTKAKIIESKIIQSSLGYTFVVILINEIQAKNALLIFITISMIILIIAIFAILIFVYKLIGAYIVTFIIFSCLMPFLTAIAFNMVIGIEIFPIIFLAIALMLDITLIYVESFKKKIFKDKQSPDAAYNFANKETNSILFSTIIIGLILFIMLFVFSTGDIKNISVIGIIIILFNLIFGILLFRFVVYLLINNKVFTKYPILLPLNLLNIKNSKFLYNNLLISYYSSKIDVLDKKENKTDKDIKKIELLNKKLSKRLSIKENKELKYNNKQIQRWKTNLYKIEYKLNELYKQLDKKPNNIKTKYINSKIDYLNEIKENISLKINQNNIDSIEIDNSNLKVIKSKLINFNKIFAIIFLSLMILGSIFTFTIGPNFTTTFGNSNSSLLYGNNVNEFYYNLDDSINTLLDKSEESTNKNHKNQLNKLSNELKNIKRNSDNEMFSKNGNIEFENLIEKEKKSLWASYVTANILRHILNNGYIALWDQKADFTSFKKIKITNGILLNNDVYNNSNNNKDIGYVLFNWNDANQKTFVYLENLVHNFTVNSANIDLFYESFDHKENEINNGYLNLSNKSFTSTKYVKEILITIGFAILVIMLFMFIQFKWTYFISYLSSIVLIILTMASAMIIFRLPIGIETLETALIMLVFSAISIILVLGKYKSLLHAKDKKTINKLFKNEVLISMSINKDKLEYKNNLKLIKKQYKEEYKKLNINSFKTKFKLFFISLLPNKLKSKLFSNNEIILLYNSYNEIKKKYKEIKKSTKKHYKQLIKVKKKEIDNNIKNNIFVKESYVNTFNFSINRVLTTGIVCLSISIILSIFLITIVGIGLTLLIGTIISIIITLSITVPLINYLEKRRIISILSYETFIRQLKVSNEEQIVKGIND